MGNFCTRWRCNFKGMRDGWILAKTSAPLSLMTTYGMSLISVGSISLDSIPLSIYHIYSWEKGWWWGGGVFTSSAFEQIFNDDVTALSPPRIFIFMQWFHMEYKLSTPIERVYSCFSLPLIDRLDTCTYFLLKDPTILCLLDFTCRIFCPEFPSFGKLEYPVAFLKFDHEQWMETLWLFTRCVPALFRDFCSFTPLILNFFRNLQSC